MASDLYDRILRVERRLRAIDLDSIAHRQRANSFALRGPQAIAALNARRDEEADDQCRGLMKVTVTQDGSPAGGALVELVRGGVTVDSAVTSSGLGAGTAFFSTSGTAPYTVVCTAGSSSKTQVVAANCDPAAIVDVKFTFTSTPSTCAACAGAWPNTLYLKGSIILTRDTGTNLWRGCEPHGATTISWTFSCGGTPSRLTLQGTYKYSFNFSSPCDRSTLLSSVCPNVGDNNGHINCAAVSLTSANCSAPVSISFTADANDGSCPEPLYGGSTLTVTS